MNPQDLIPPEYRNADEKTVHDQAANLIRTKLDHLYSHEPNARKESAEVKELVAEHEKLSKHQKYMKHLNESGLDTAEVQTKWHEYYAGLSETEKHEVWREFYTEQEYIKKKKDEISEQQTQQPKPAPKQQIHQTRQQYPARKLTQNKHLQKVGGRLHKAKNNHHIRSLIFGLSMGFLVIFVLLFSFFNERFIIPFIQPNTNVSATPIIVDYDSGPVGPEPKIIIPKINLEAPVVYDVESIEEKVVQAGLENGVLHYSTTPDPGEMGNSVIFGHSSGNILNKGKYKFAFLLLKSLDEGDTFIVQKDGKRFVYKIYNKYVTNPEDVSVLESGDKPAMMTLITCDPPGTSTNRLIVQAEQIFPDPKTNKPSSVAPQTVSQPVELPSNSPSLWQRIFGD